MTERWSAAARDLVDTFDEMINRGVHAVLDPLGPREAEQPRESQPTTSPAQEGLSEVERDHLRAVDLYLERGQELVRWWRRARQNDRFERRFELASTYNRPDSSFGFFDESSVGGSPMPIMGNFQEMQFDRVKVPAAQRAESANWIQQQIRQFVLRYFMRVSDFRQPQVVVDRDSKEPPALLKPVSLCSEKQPSKIGFGFTQHYYKLRESGEIGRFPAEEQSRIIDLRELGGRYAWIVVKVKIFNFSFAYRPFPGGPSLTLPLAEESYLVLSRDFILDEEKPSAGELGHYGIGYSFLPSPKPGLLAYGPGRFAAAIELIDFHVHTDGRVRVSMAFVANRPERILDLPLNPLIWGLDLSDLVLPEEAGPLLWSMRRALSSMPLFGAMVDPVYVSLDLANLVSGGLASRELCWDRETLELEFLAKHFMQHYETVVGSLQTWRQIPDWLDEAALPEWVKRGHSG